MISRTLLEKIAAHLYATMIGVAALLAGIAVMLLLGTAMIHHPIIVLIMTICIMGWGIGFGFILPYLENDE